MSSLIDPPQPPPEIYYRPPGGDKHVKLAESLDELYAKIENLTIRLEKLENGNETVR